MAATVGTFHALVSTGAGWGVTQCRSLEQGRYRRIVGGPGVPGLQVVLTLPQLGDVVLCKITRFYEIKQSRTGGGEGKQNQLQGSIEGRGERGCEAVLEEKIALKTYDSKH